MKLRRFMCMVLTLCMVLTFFSALQVTVSAANSPTWEYSISVEVPDVHEAQSKKNAISVDFYFADGTSSGKKIAKKLPNTDQKNTTVTIDWFESGYAPWTLQTVNLINNTTNGYYMHSIEIKCRYLGSKTAQIVKVYPGGTGKYDGYWIDKDDGHPRVYSVPLSTARNITAVTSLDNIAKTVHLTIEGNSSNYYTTCEWDGKLTDQYSSLSYNALTCGGGNAPEIKVTASGYKSSGNVSSSNFKAASESVDKTGIIITDKGYKYNQKKLIDYMNANEINRIELSIELKVPKSYSISDCYTKTVTAAFVRDIFGFKTVTLSGANFTDEVGNHYYNASGSDRIITVKAKINSESNNYKHYSGGYFDDCWFNFDDAYLQSGDLKIPIKKESAYQISNGVVTFKFEYPKNADSKNQGLYLYIKNGRIWIDKTKYKLWDASNGYKDNNDRYFKQYHSSYKVDAKVPTVTISAHNDTNLSKWNQTALLNISLSEESYANGRTQGETMLSLVAKDGLTQETFLYGVESDNATKGNSSNAQEIPTLIAPSSEKLSITVPYGVEGKYLLKFEGEDVAGNKYSVVSDDCLMLDRKAPEIVMNVSEPSRDNDTGKMSITSNVKLTDVSNTGRFYYIFTEKTMLEALTKLPLDLNSIDKVSGSITSLKDVWMYRDKDELYSENGSTILYEVKNDETFNGRIIYFAKDEAGNVSAWGEKPIVMKNEDTTYSFAAEKVNGGQSYKIKIEMKSEKNTVSYAWYYVNEKSKKVYLYGADDSGNTVYKTYNGTIDTAEDNATKELNGEWYLEIKIKTPTGSVLTDAKKYVFDNEAPDITITVPSDTSYAPSQLIYITAEDATGVSANGTTRRIVNRDGSEIDGMGEVALNVTDGSVSDYVRAGSLPTGAYAVKVKATDVNGASKEVVSDPFFIRNGVHEGEIKISSELEYGEMPLIKKGENVKVELNVTESFANLRGDDKNQALYYRISDATVSYGEWIKAGTMYKGGTSFSYNGDISISGFLYEDGALNELYIQTAICPAELSEAEAVASINSNNIRTDKVEFYYDESAPTCLLTINDVHTKDSISGVLHAEDNLDSTLTVSCDDSNVTIGEPNENGDYIVTVSENVNTEIQVKDDAGNTQSVDLVIKNIDKKPPTAEMTVTTEDYGERKDAAAELIVYDMVYATEIVTLESEDEDSTEEDGTEVESSEEEPKTALVNRPMFALIPNGTYKAGTYESGTIDDKYFKENLSDDVYFEVEEIRSDIGTYAGEFNKTYKIKVAGIDGKWNIGVHAQDSLGNAADIVLKGTLETEYPEELSASASAKPKNAESLSIVTVEFNRPVYVLAQDKIITTDYGDDDAENPNYELLEEYAFNYSDKLTFRISKNGTYKLYTIDDLGRKEAASVTIDDVTFGAAGGIKYSILDGDGNEIDMSETMICPCYGTSYYLEITPEETGTLLLPKKDYYVERWENGFLFDENRSWDYAVKSDGTSCETVYDEIFGYTKLCYQIEQIFDGSGGYSDTAPRIITVQAFKQENDTGDTTEQILVVDNIDNTAPNVSWTVSPNVLVKYLDDDGRTKWKKNPTPGKVVFTFTAQDAESGIGKVLAIGYAGKEFYAEPDSDGYWSWSGEDYPEGIIGYDENLEPIYGKIPVTIEFYGDKKDPYGVKTLIYTFTDEVDLTSISGYETAVFTNCLGANSEINDDSLKMISTEGLIYSMPIEKGKDYTVQYTLSDGTVITADDIENNYYNNIIATIEKTERGTERGLSIANNGGKQSINLNSYQSVFTFDIKDKYGYGAYETVELKNFDVTPGTLSYSIETTEKTNQDVGITITAKDADSGVGEVKLSVGTTAIELTKSEGGSEKNCEYIGKLPQSGIYNITMYDKSGNKTVSNFVVSNINKDAPEATVTYSCADKTWVGDENEPASFYTSRPVTASLSFSKTNVWIAEVEPAEGGTIGTGDYSVNYGDNSITIRKSGTLGVKIKDEYGNTKDISVIVRVIDKTPPTVTAVVTPDKTSAIVTFNKQTNVSSKKDLNRSEKDIYVAYGAMVKTVADKDGNKNSFTFTESGDYTFKVYDAEGLYSTLNINIKIDKSSPKITRASWSYEYYDTETDKYVTVTKDITREDGTITDGTVGYRVAADENKITNQDVSVEVETDSPTRILGGIEKSYSTVKEKLYDDNGFYVFDLEKANGKTVSYGVDIQVIDKTPPVINLFDKNEMMFYEIDEMNKESYGDEWSRYDVEGLEKYDVKDLLMYEAYDVFGGEKTILTDKVNIDWGGFDAGDLYSNKFDSSNPYTITYKVSDAANNTRTVTRTIRLVGKNDTLVLVNGELPDYSGRKIVSGDKVTLSIENFSGTAYVKCMDGIKTMGEMKKSGVLLEANKNGEYELTYSRRGWITFYIQTDKRDYFTISVYAGE